MFPPEEAVIYVERETQEVQMPRQGYLDHNLLHRVVDVCVCGGGGGEGVCRIRKG